MLKKNNLLIFFSLLSFELTPAVVFGQENDTSKNREIELGAAYVSDDSYRFGRYNGLTDEGPYAIANIKTDQYFENGSFLSIRGTNLGLDSRYLRLETGLKGNQEYFLEYDQLPAYKNNTPTTPYFAAGTDKLLLNPLNTQVPFDIETERRRFGLGVDFFIKNRWKLDVAYRHETKDGTDTTGSAMAPLKHGGFISRTTGALLPEPINYKTDIMDVALNYDTAKAQLQFAYHGSFFSNDDESLSWQDYFDPVRYGQMALAPDNQLHQFDISGGYSLPYNSRITGIVSVGRAFQDDSFLPYSTHLQPDPLPVNSLDGDVWLTTAQLKLTSRPFRKLRLNAQYRYNERDNNTEVNTYDYVVADGVDGESVTNNPLSYKRNKIDLGANYRINSSMSLQGAYQFNQMDRNYSGEKKDHTRENTLSAKWKVKPLSELNLSLFGEAGWRRGNDYKLPENENPAMRRYYLADRNRTKVGASAEYMPTDKLSLGFTGEYIRDDYENSIIGLTESSQPVYTLDASYQIRENITSYMYYSHEDIKSTQAGSELGTTTPDWWADFDDKMDSLGMGIKFTRLSEKWDAGADLVYTRSNGEIDMQKDNSLIPGQTDQYPDLETSLTSLKLWANYQYSKNTTYKLSYWFEQYDADNWAIDDLSYNSIDNMLLLGEETLDDNVHVIGLSVNINF